MKVTLNITNYQKEEVEIIFPIYRQQILDYCTIYTIVESEDRQISIDLSDDGDEASIKVSKPNFLGSKDYLLGQGQHYLSQNDFKKAMIELQAFLTKTFTK